MKLHSNNAVTWLCEINRMSLHLFDSKLIRPWGSAGVGSTAVIQLGTIRAATTRTMKSSSTAQMDINFESCYVLVSHPDTSTIKHIRLATATIAI